MILVTGGTGLVGSHLLYELTKRGQKVKALIREASNTYWVEKVFSWYNPDGFVPQMEGIEWVQGDIADIVSLREALQGIEKIYHCAAVVSFEPSQRPAMLKINVDGTANLVNAALLENVKKICHCSSIAAIGRPEKGLWVDESLIWKTSSKNSWYSISKFGAEREVWRGQEEGLDAIIVNPSVILGPGDPDRSSARIFSTVKKGLKFYTDGSTGFVDARDVASIMVDLMESDYNGERFILNCENLSYKEVFKIFADAAQVKAPRIKIGKIISEMAWRLEKIRTLITQSTPLITKETAKSAYSKYYFSNKKIGEALNTKFTPVKKSAENLAAFFEKNPEI